MSCASVQPQKAESKFNVSYTDFSFDEVWSAAMKAVDDIEFTIRKMIKESGFIYAEGRRNPSPLYLPPHMNVIIREENGRINVNCHVVLPGQITDFEASKRYVRWFFKDLNKNLNR